MGVGESVTIPTKELEIILAERDLWIVDILRREMFLVVYDLSGPSALDA